MKKRKENVVLKNDTMKKETEKFEDDIFDLMFNETANINDLNSFIKKYPLNSIDRDGRNMLMNFIIENKVEFANYLIEHGIDLSIQDNNGYTCLHFAVQEKNIELIKIILEKSDKSILDITDNYGDTSLWKAIKTDTKSLEIIDILVKKGADLNKKNKKKISPLDKMKNNPLVFKKYIDSMS
jgi:uncharacterized protein